ncbi:MAG: ComEC/Rec2 family competence protein [Solirubrobacterales bacterium]
MALACLALGLGASPRVGATPFVPAGLVLLVGTLVLLSGNRGPAALALTAAAAAIAGLAMGSWRIEAIEGQALRGSPGEELSVTCVLLEAPRRTSEGWKAAVECPEGRLLIEAGGGLPEGPGPGDRVEAVGRLGEVPPWLSSGLGAEGIRLALAVRRVRFGPSGRDGLRGLVDSIRDRAEDALGFGIPPPQAALARGFVLGQDQAIEPEVTDRFRDSGLAHLLAVSGQNVMLLLLLAWVVLSLVGVPLRFRYPLLAGLVCLYVPLAGSGPSIQRAGIMGLAGLAAASAGRPLDRVFPVVLAAAITLGLNPFSAGDVGWQLSFAAVVGILALARPISDRILEFLAGRAGRFGEALSLGLSVTVAATLATLPLIGFHFGRLPLGTVAANLLALPAVAPSMWLGMLAATIGQVAPWLALPFNLANSVLLAFIGWIASLFGGSGQVLDTGGGIATLVGGSSVAALLAFLMIRRAAWACVLVGISLALPVWGLLTGPRGALPPPPAGGVAVDVLDIGQGDAILVRTPSTDPILVDTGPPGGDVSGAIGESGGGRLGALVLTHLDRDHVGEFDRVIESFEVGSVLADQATNPMRAAIRSEGATFRRIGTGDQFRLGPAELEVLWPPLTGSGPSPGDRNARSVVLMIRVGRRTILLTGDAEAELVPLDPGPIDVLKVAHHGSEDIGLPQFLAGTGPAIAVISAGKGNPYGHPVESTTSALEEAGSTTYRTDRDGSISVLIEASGRISVEKSG